MDLSRVFVESRDRIRSETHTHRLLFSAIENFDDNSQNKYAVVIRLGQHYVELSTQSHLLHKVHCKNKLYRHIF